MSKTLKYSLCVFIGGCTYGLVIPCVRIILDWGFTPLDAMTSQYCASVVILATAVVLFSRRKMNARQVLQLLFMGVVSALVSLFYYNSIALISASAAVTLLFQFVWMGVVVQAVLERRAPRPLMLASVAVVMVGTVLAVGIADEGLGGLDALGVVYGLLSAVAYTALLFATSRLATELPPVNRTLFSAMGSLAFALVIGSSFVAEGVFAQGIFWMAVPLGLAGLVLPISLISTGSPHLPPGITTILAAGELPCGVLAAVVFLGDPITPLVALGLVIGLAGIVPSPAPEIKSLLTSRKRT
jgi:drug/metabolite transporter (DMT)-like permease